MMTDDPTLTAIRARLEQVIDTERRTEPDDQCANLQVMEDALTLINQQAAEGQAQCK